MKIGIFGGSFNPPHKMHKNIALQLIQKKYLDKVIYVPTSNYYKKEGLISDKDRYEMLKCMIQENASLEVSDYEFGKLTYTYQTLNYFKEKYPQDEIYFICGTDNLIQLDTWKNYFYILENFKLIVIPRDNDDIKYLLRKYKSENIFVANILYDSISSTKIRYLLKMGQEVDGWLDQNVKRYILKSKLYSSD